MKYNIFHLDMDSFFASVEMAENPTLKNKPMCVAAKNKYGIISSSNYIARQMGVDKCATPISIAKKVCPSLIVVEHNMNKYIEVSNKIHNFLINEIPNVENGSIDEWYIDTHDSKYESWSESDFAFYIKSEIKKRFDLECTIGCSYTKFLAKMATNQIKPNGFLIFTEKNYKSYIYDLDVQEMYMVGSKLSEVFKKNKINKIKDLVNFKDDIYMDKVVGTIWHKLKNEAQGISFDKVNSKNNNITKTIGKSWSISEFSDINEFKNLINELIFYINTTLEKSNSSFKNLTCKLKISKHQYETQSTRFKYGKYKIDINDAYELFEKAVSKYSYQQIKNVAFSVHDLVYEIGKVEQLNLFSNNKETNNPYEQIVNKVNQDLNKKILFIANDLVKNK